MSADNRPAAPPTDAGGDTADLFARMRPSLHALAYRFLGSVADAEDIVQETFVRWQAADKSNVAQPEAFLRRIAARLCLDQLKSARSRREQYVGTWLPEPLVDRAGWALPSDAGVAHDVSVALLLALERLSPLERAVFLLSDVFGESFDEIAATLERSPASCRQLAVRARNHVRAARPRFPVADDEATRIAAAFERAAHSGNTDELMRLLAPQAQFHSDGGGRVRAALRPIFGREKIVRLLASLARKKGPPRVVRPVRINGLCGFIVEDSQGVTQTITIETEHDQVVAVYLMRNPDKLRHVTANG